MDISATMTLGDVRLWYLLRYRDEHAHNTLEKTRTAFDHLIATVGDVRVDRLTPQMGEAFIAAMQDRHLKPSSIVGYVKQVRPVIHRVRSLLRRDVPACRNLNVEIWSAKALRTPKVGKRNIRTYDPAEALRLIASANEPLATAMAVGMTTGLRRGALFNLCRFEIDMREGCLRVQSKDDDLIEGTWKWQAKATRDVTKPVPSWVMDRIRQLFNQLPAYQPYIHIPPARYERLRGLIGQLPPSTRLNPVPHANNQLNALFDKTGVAKRGRAFHALKSTFVTEALRGGASPQDVAALADHSSPTTTMRYYAAVGGHACAQVRTIMDGLGPDRIGVAGFEPTTPRPPAECSGQAELHPVKLIVHRFGTG